MKPPKGDHRRLPRLWARMLEDCHAVGEGRKGWGKALLAGSRRKKTCSGAKIRPQTMKNISIKPPPLIEMFSGWQWLDFGALSLQNRGPGPPKSSPEPSETTFLKTSNLRRLLEGQGLQVWWPKLPTWLQLGSPRGSKIEARTRKNRCQKTTRFQHRF